MEPFQVFTTKEIEIGILFDRFYRLLEIILRANANIPIN